MRAHCVKPNVKRQKTDMADAEAIAEGAIVIARSGGGFDILGGNGRESIGGVVHRDQLATFPPESMANGADPLRTSKGGARTSGFGQCKFRRLRVSD